MSVSLERGLRKKGFERGLSCRTEVRSFKILYEVRIEVRTFGGRRTVGFVLSMDMSPVSAFGVKLVSV